MIYHLQVTVRLGCGCEFGSMYELEEGDEPHGGAIATALVDTMTDPRVLALIATDEHDEHGNEKVDIEVRTKVGPIPEETT